MRYSLLAVIAVFLLVYSCRKEIVNDTFQSKQPLIAEAKSYFEHDILEVHLEDIQNTIKKSPKWADAKVINTSIGEAVVVPIKYEKKLLVQAEGEKKSTPLEKTSYLIVYKNKKKAMQAEWVTLVPIGKNKSGKFIGLLTIHAFDGKFKRGFAFGQNGEVMPVTLSSSTFRKASTAREMACFSFNTYFYIEIAGNSRYKGMRIDTYCFTFSDGNTEIYNDSGVGDGGVPMPDDYTQVLDCAGVVGGTAKFSAECQTCIGGTTGIEKCPTKNPCDETIKLAQDAKFKQLFTNLKNQVSDNKEYGYFFDKDSNGKITNETPITGLANTAEIEFDVAHKIDGYIHSHYTGLLPVFSFSDLEAMAIIYKNGKMNDPKAFTAGVVTSTDTQYLLFIDDIDQFKAFANSITRPDVHDNYEYLYRDVFKINTSNSVEVNEKGLLQFLSSNKSGLALMKGTGTFDSWERKSLSNNNTVISNPCK